MIRRIIAAVFTIFAGVSTANALEPGCTAPEMRFSDGTSLTTLRGRLIYIDFWASWCGPCKQSFPWMEELQRKFNGLDVVAVNVDADRKDADEFLASQKSSFRLVFDPEGKIPEAYEVEGMPSSFLVGPDGKILFKHRGFRDSDKKELEEQIEKYIGASTSGEPQ